MKRRRLAWCLACALSAPVVGGSGVARADEPVRSATPATDAFRARHDAVVKLVAKGAPATKLEEEVERLIDYGWIAHGALGGESQYAAACGSHCDEFEALLTRVIRKSYLELVKQAQRVPLEYLGEQAGRNQVYKVETRLTIDKHGRKQAVKVDFVLHHQAGTWKVRDIITDDVSLAKTYRYEFQRQLASGGIEAVLASLRAKVQAD